MITREEGYLVAECDTCGDTFDTEVREFYLVPDTLKQNGWTITKEGDGSWTHRCPGCSKEARNPQNDFKV